jgi:hypothetical protein
MKLIYRRLCRLVCIQLSILLVCSQAFAQVTNYRLYAPEGPGKPSCFVGGTIDLTPRDQYESSLMNFSATGPISYFINGDQNPSTFSGDELKGMVCADTSSPDFPAPGDSAYAYLNCDYTITYSSPLDPLYPTHGGPSAINVSQTTGAVWNCGGTADQPCAAGHTSKSQHTLVTEKGRINYSFVVFAAANPCDKASITGPNTVNVDAAQRFDLAVAAADPVQGNVTWAVNENCANKPNGNNITVTPTAAHIGKTVTITATFKLKSGANCTKTKTFTVPPRPVTGNMEIYRSMKRVGGAWIASPDEGSPNSSQMGARIPPHNVPDIKPAPAGKDGMVGPGVTGIDGLSSTPTASKRPGDDLGKITANQLPAGLAAIQDKPGHISIYPTKKMKFKEFQQLLNQIPWALVP